MSASFKKTVIPVKLETIKQYKPTHSGSPKQVMLNDSSATTADSHQYPECAECLFLTTSKTISLAFPQVLVSHVLQRGRLQQRRVLKWLLILHTDRQGRRRLPLPLLCLNSSLGRLNILCMELKMEMPLHNCAQYD